MEFGSAPLKHLGFNLLGYYSACRTRLVMD